MQFFKVENLQQSMKLPDLYLSIGVSSEEVYVVRDGNYLVPVVRIKLEKLVIRFSGFLI